MPLVVSPITNQGRQAMDFPSVTALASAATVVLLSFCITRILWGSKKRYPPMAGTMFHQLLNFERLHDYHTEVSRQYKTFRLLAPFRNQIYITDPANVEYILRTNFNNYGKGWLNYGILGDLLGEGIFAVDGDKWRHQRKLASYEFSTKVLRDFSGAVFKRNAAKLAQILSERASSHQVMDIQELFMKSSMDSIFKVGFGVELNTLHGVSEGSQFVKAIDDSSESTMRRYIDIFWKIKKLLNIGSEAELKKNMKMIDDFIYKIICAKTKEALNQRNDSERKEDILSRFLIERDKDPESMTDKYLRDIILNFLVAGKDSTAGTLSWFIYMLCKHPSVQEKVTQEIKEVIQQSEDMKLGEFADNITEEALDNMHYVHAALSETLRLYPPIPLNSKVCFSDDVLPDDFNVRKGDIVFYQPYAMGRMESLWGMDAEIFRPERWLDENGYYKPESPFKFTAFQAGPRICLGKEFAYRQMKIFAAVLLRFFTFKLSEKSREVSYRTMLTLHIDQGLHIHAFHR